VLQARWRPQLQAREHLPPEAVGAFAAGAVPELLLLQHLQRRLADALLNLSRYQGLRVWPCLAQPSAAELLSPKAEAWQRPAQRVA